MTYSFHCYNAMANFGSVSALKRLLGETTAPPVIICIGSDLVIGDSLGPIVGTMLQKNDRIGGYVYGTLRSPVTAKEIKYVEPFVRYTHPNSKIIAIDAAFGAENEIGLVKFSNGPLSPGSGVNKCLLSVGDVHALGIVAAKTPFPYQTLELTRLNLVYRMAELISETLLTLFASKTQNQVI